MNETYTALELLFAIKWLLIGAVPFILSPLIKMIVDKVIEKKQKTDIIPTKLVDYWLPGLFAITALFSFSFVITMGVALTTLGENRTDIPSLFSATLASILLASLLFSSNVFGQILHFIEKSKEKTQKNAIDKILPKIFQETIDNNFIFKNYNLYKQRENISFNNTNLVIKKDYNYLAFTFDEKTRKINNLRFSFTKAREDFISEISFSKDCLNIKVATDQEITDFKIPYKDLELKKYQFIKEEFSFFEKLLKEEIDNFNLTYEEKSKEVKRAINLDEILTKKLEKTASQKLDEVMDTEGLSEEIKLQLSALKEKLEKNKEFNLPS